MKKNTTIGLLLAASLGLASCSSTGIEDTDIPIVQQENNPQQDEEEEYGGNAKYGAKNKEDLALRFSHEPGKVMKHQKDADKQAAQRVAETMVYAVSDYAAMSLNDSRVAALAVSSPYDYLSDKQHDDIQEMSHHTRMLSYVNKDKIKYEQTYSLIQSVSALRELLLKNNLGVLHPEVLVDKVEVKRNIAVIPVNISSDDDTPISYHELQLEKHNNIWYVSLDSAQQAVEDIIHQVIFFG